MGAGSGNVGSRPQQKSPVQLRSFCTKSTRPLEVGAPASVRPTTIPDGMGTIRSDWLGQADAAVDRLADDLSSIDVRESRFLLEHFITTLDAPPDALHGAVLATILMDACERIVHALHDQNPKVACACEATIWTHVSRFSKWRESDPRIAFTDWIDIFFAGIDKEHPADLAVRAAQVIRRDVRRGWTLEALAAAVESRPLALSRQFQQRFGMRPAAYVHLVRATRAIGLLRSSAKVQAVALDLGYRSKKDLYAALNRWADATPTQLRAQTAEESEWLERELKQRCLKGIGERFSVSVRVAPSGGVSGGGNGRAHPRAFRR